MKVDYAWTFAGKPRGETPAPPPGKRTVVLARLPACRALFRQTGKCIFPPFGVCRDPACRRTASPTSCPNY